MENVTPKKKRKGCLTGTLIAVAVFVGFVVLVIVLNPSTSPTQSEPSVSVPIRSELATLLDVTEEQEAAILRIFEECGIGQVTHISLFQSGEQQTSFHVNDVETAAFPAPIVVWISNVDKNVYSIYYRDFDIFVDGITIGNVMNHYVSQNERDTYRTAAQLLITDCLSFPLSAEFKNYTGWVFDRQEGNIVTQSSVVAQNALGVKSESMFQVTFNEFGTPISIILDGEEFLK